METLVIRIAKFHPAIISALAGRNVENILAAVNKLYEENDARGDNSQTVKSKGGKNDVTFTAASKITAKLPKDRPETNLARVHWYLNSSREYFTKVTEVELPQSVRDWVKAKTFDLPVETQTTADKP